MAKQEANSNYTTVLETVLMEMSAKNPEMASDHIEGRLRVINEEAILLRKILKKISVKKGDTITSSNSSSMDEGLSNDEVKQESTVI